MMLVTMDFAENLLRLILHSWFLVFICFYLFHSSFANNLNIKTFEIFREEEIAFGKQKKNVENDTSFLYKLLRAQ